jgi:hypothetical protein
MVSCTTHPKPRTGRRNPAIHPHISPRQTGGFDPTSLPLHTDANLSFPPISRSHLCSNPVPQGTAESSPGLQPGVHAAPLPESRKGRLKPLNSMLLPPSQSISHATFFHQPGYGVRLYLSPLPLSLFHQDIIIISYFNPDLSLSV